MNHQKERFKPCFKSYKGFVSMEELSIQLKKMNISLGMVVILEYKKEYYAIYYGGHFKQISFGKELVFSRESGYMRTTRIEDFKLPYELKGRGERNKITERLIDELLETDPGFKVYIYKNRNSKQSEELSDFRQKYSNHLMVFAATLFENELKKEELGRVCSKYFRSVKALKKIHTPIVDTLNPFKQYVVLKSGEVIPFKFGKYQKFNAPGEVYYQLEYLPMSYKKKYAGYSLDKGFQ